MDIIINMRVIGHEEMKENRNFEQNLNIYKNIKYLDIPYNVNTFTFLTKYLLFKQTVGADGTDKPKQENYICFIFVC